MTGCYRLVIIIVVWYGQAPLPILGLDAAAGKLRQHQVEHNAAIIVGVVTVFSVLYLANKFIEQSYEPSMPSDTSHKGLARYFSRLTRQQ